MKYALLAVAMLSVAADGADLAASAAQARTGAQQQLADARKTILAERTATAAHVQELQNRLAELRNQLESEQRAAKQSEDEERQRRLSQERDRQKADHVLAMLETKAGLNSTGEPLAQRLASIQAAFKTRVERFAGHFSVSARDEAVSSRAGAPVTVPVLRVGDAAAIALGDGRDQRGMLQRLNNGWLISGPALPGSPAHFESGRVATVPLDISATLARATAPEKFTLAAWLRAGGFFMWPIGLVGLIGLAFVIERCSWFARMRSNGELGQALASAHDRQRLEETLAPQRTPLQRLLRAGIQVPPAGREAALEGALLAEETRIQRGIGVLAVLAGVAPLLGLLGTVTGMIGMSATIAGHGTGNGQLLSGDISVALVTTQFGLIVAVPLMIAHALLARIAEKRQAELEGAANAILDLKGAHD